MKVLKFNTLTLSMCLLTSLGFNQAHAIEYLNDNIHSNWTYSGSNVQCKILQNINEWGSIEFLFNAARIPKLEIYLKPDLAFSRNIDIHTKSYAPNWQPGKADKVLGNFTVYKMFDGYVTDELAWSILKELQSGRGISFIYKDEYYYKDDFANVKITPYNFSSVYDDFLNCRLGLLNYSFDDIKYAVIHFNGKTKGLTDYSYKRLTDIANYLSSDTNFSEVVITVHTDSVGETDENQKLTEEQGNYIKEFFLRKGIPNNKIVVKAYGEEQQAVTNEYWDKLPINRRVIIEVNTGNKFSD